MQNNWVKFWEHRKGPMSVRVRHAFGRNFRTAYNVYLNHRIGTPASKQEPYSKKFLEVGCGRGTMSELFKRNGFDVHGVDIMRDCIKTYPGKLVLGDAFTLPFKDHSFVFVMTYGLLEHFVHEDQIKLILEINRVVRDEMLALHYVVPGKLMNIFEDRSVYRNPCKELIKMFKPGWVFPAFGNGDWETNKYLGKAFWIYTKNTYGERDENRSIDNSEVSQHTSSIEELSTPWGSFSV